MRIGREELYAGIQDGTRMSRVFVVMTLRDTNRDPALELDELLDPTDKSPTPYRDVLTKISGLVPRTTRFLVACRTAALK